MKLFHFSENPDIKVFTPHVAPTSVDQQNAYVWAIDEWHAPMYYFPRDCPRACFWPAPETTDADREQWFGGINARMVIAVESGWFERIRSTTVYRYTMPAAPFRQRDAIAGHWVCRETIHPLAVDALDDLPGALVAADVELRITPTLLDMWSRVIASSLAFSGTRLRNARS